MVIMNPPLKGLIYFTQMKYYFT